MYKRLILITRVENMIKRFMCFLCGHNYKWVSSSPPYHRRCKRCGLDKFHVRGDIWLEARLTN